MTEKSQIPTMSKRLLLVIGILLAVPLTVYLTVRFFLYTPEAAPDASIYFQPASASMPPDSVARLMIDTQNEDLIAGRVDLSFDRNKVQLADEITPNDIFTNIISVTSMNEANSTGEISVVLAVSPGESGASGLFEFAKLPFTSVTTANTTAVVSVNEGAVQLVNSNEEEYTFTSGVLTFDLNPNTGTPLADTDLWIQPESSNVSVGSVFEVQIWGNTGANEVVATELYLEFDPSNVSVTDIVPGPTTNDPVFFADPVEVSQDINNASGELEYVLVTLPENTEPVNGRGVIATLQLQALRSGNSVIDFLPTTLVPAIDSDGLSVLKSTQGAEIIVGTGPVATATPTTLPTNTPAITRFPCPLEKAGDINHDCTVNILDYTVWFENFGIEFDENDNPNVSVTPYGSTPEPRADINNDGVVNTLDFVIWFENFEFAI